MRNDGTRVLMLGILSALALSALPCRGAELTAEPVERLGALREEDRLAAVRDLNRLSGEGRAFWLEDMSVAFSRLLRRIEDPEENLETRRFAALGLFQAAMMAGAGEQVAGEPNRSVFARNALLFQRRSLEVLIHLEDSDPLVREFIVRTLVVIMPRPPLAAVEPLLAKLEDSEPKVRIFAALALARIRPVSEEVVGALVAQMEEGGGPSEAAARALGQLFSHDAGAALTIARRLESDDPQVRLQALDASAVAGFDWGNGRAARPLKDSTDDTHQEKMMGRRVARALGAVLGDSDLALGITAASSLGSMGPAGIAARRSLRAVAEDEEADSRLRRIAARALARVEGK